MDWLTSFFWTWPHWTGFGIAAGVSIFCFFGFMSEAFDNDRKQSNRRESARFSLAALLLGVPASAVWFVILPFALVCWMAYGMFRLVKVAEFGKATE